MVKQSCDNSFLQDDITSIGGNLAAIWRAEQWNPFYDNSESLNVHPYARHPKPQRSPSYIAVMLNMTDAAASFPLTPHSLFQNLPVQSNLCTRTI